MTMDPGTAGRPARPPLRPVRHRGRRAEQRPCVRGPRAAAITAAAASSAPTSSSARGRRPARQTPPEQCLRPLDLAPAGRAPRGTRIRHVLRDPGDGGGDRTHRRRRRLVASRTPSTYSTPAARSRASSSSSPPPGGTGEPVVHEPDRCTEWMLVAAERAARAHRGLHPRRPGGHLQRHPLLRHGLELTPPPPRRPARAGLHAGPSVRAAARPATREGVPAHVHHAGRMGQRLLRRPPLSPPQRRRTLAPRHPSARPRRRAGPRRRVRQRRTRGSPGLTRLLSWTPSTGPSTALIQAHATHGTTVRGCAWTSRKTQGASSIADGYDLITLRLRTLRS